jgi:3-hydroxyethyl bacteriochlorophyllide a dehydrogenase
VHTNAVVLTAPEHLSVQNVALSPCGDEDVVVDIAWSGISTGTERLLYTGRMPPFPGMGYPLVPGYESVGRVGRAGARAGVAEGALVFVPGASCYGEIRGLFGGTASRVVTRGARVVPVPETLGEQASLLALAATAQHALTLPGAGVPELIVGHGTVGRLLARLAIAAGGAPVVWETDAARHKGAAGYDVIDPAQDARRDYRCIVDASGNAGLLDTLIARLAPGGAVVLAGFYDTLSFTFPPAFMREARILIAAQFTPADTAQVLRLVGSGAVSLDGLITHRAPAGGAQDAYRTAFSDTSCLKMVLDWRDFA